MKIKETVERNIQITMSKEETYAILSLLLNMNYVDYCEYVHAGRADKLCDVWAFLDSHKTMFYPYENS